MVARFTLRRCRQSPKQRRQVAGLLGRYGPSGLTQVTTQPRAALPRASTLSFPRAFPVAGTHSRPAGQVVRVRKLPPVQVEGQINRLKMIKRQMFGRAGFGLLRARVLPYSPAAFVGPAP